MPQRLCPKSPPVASIGLRLAHFARLPCHLNAPNVLVKSQMELSTWVFNRGFHSKYKPSILGYSYFWKHLLTVLKRISQCSYTCLPYLGMLFNMCQISDAKLQLSSCTFSLNKLSTSMDHRAIRGGHMQISCSSSSLCNGHQW